MTTGTVMAMSDLTRRQYMSGVAYGSLDALKNVLDTR